MKFNNVETDEHIILIKKQLREHFRKTEPNLTTEQLNNRVSDLQEEVYSGLATVTALTALHPNPRSTEPVELSLGTGIFRDQCAGAAGLFVHPNDRVMIQGGAAFGNNNDWAGYVGLTLGIGKAKLGR